MQRFHPCCAHPRGLRTNCPPLQGNRIPPKWVHWALAPLTEVVGDLCPDPDRVQPLAWVPLAGSAAFCDFLWRKLGTGPGTPPAVSAATPVGWVAYGEILCGIAYTLPERVGEVVHGSQGCE